MAKTPMHQCSACNTRFVEAERDPEYDAMFCPGCGASVEYAWPIPDHIVMAVFFAIIDRSYTRKQRVMLLRQFDSSAD